MTAPPQDTSRSVFSALIAVQILFGVNYLASKIIVTAMAPGAWAALRTSGAFLILAIISVAGKRKLPPMRDIGLLAVAALFGIVLNQGLFLEGLARTTVARSALICSQIPIFALLAALVVRQEKFTWRKLMVFALGLAGVLILLKADTFSLDRRYLLGDLLTLANAACYGIFVVFSRRIMSRNDPLAATAVVFFFGALGMIIYGGQDVLALDLAIFQPDLLATMAYVILGATVLTYFLNLWALKRVGASHVAAFIFLQPLLATTLAVIFRGEEITLRFGLAALFVLIALFLRDEGK
jgi:drug/metabolite transporter (DMT)-like permease